MAGYLHHGSPARSARVLAPIGLNLNPREQRKTRGGRIFRKPKNVDFTDRLSHASGSGRGKVKKALLLVMGRMSIDDIDPSDRADFERALHG